MLGLDLKIEKFCQNVIQPKIDAGGFDSRKIAEIVLFYAGPSEEVVAALCAKHPKTEPEEYIKNWVTAAEESERLVAKRIDDAPIFDYLRSEEFKEDFISATGITEIGFEDEKTKVWIYVSDKFSRTDFQEAATLVCGAGEDSAFVLKEMLGMLDGDHLKILNKRSADLFRAFKPLGNDEVQRLMSMTYLLELRAYAKAHKDADAMKLYKRLRDYFLVWRQDRKDAFCARPKEIKLAFRQARKEILEAFGGTAPPASPSASSPAARVACGLM